MAENPELEALRALIVQAHAIVSTSHLPEDRSERAPEILVSAIAMADHLIAHPAAAVLGKKGGSKTAERSPEYYESASRSSVGYCSSSPVGSLDGSG